jgi:SAM-dependent methyltransferase
MLYLSNDQEPQTETWQKTYTERKTPLSSMTQLEIAYIQSPEGLALLQLASRLDGDELSVLGQLRKSHAAEHCRIAVHLLALRKRAETKFSRAKDMVFDREGLEQSSGETIARYRAKRYQRFAQITDLCCGIGGDTLAMAESTRVIAADLSPDRAAITRHNARVYGVGDNVRTICADVSLWIPPGDALFMDPGRRQGNRRLYALSDYHPPVDLERLQSVTGNIGLKVAPGMPDSDIPTDCEVEFISESGSCKEALLWFGDLQSGATRRATLLPGGHSLIHRPTDPAPVQVPGAFIAEPDNAVVRCHLIDQLADELNAWKLAPDVAYLSANHPLVSPFTTCYAVQETMPFNLKSLQKYLSGRQIGRLDIKKRHFPVTPEELRAKLKLQGGGWLTLFLTRIDDRPVVIVCDPLPT